MEPWRGAIAGGGELSQVEESDRRWGGACSGPWPGPGWAELASIGPLPSVPCLSQPPGFTRLITVSIYSGGLPTSLASLGCH